MYPSPFFEEQAELKSQPILQNGGDPAMINQNYLFHIFVTKNRPVITKTLNLKFENVSFTNLWKKY